MTTDPRCSIDPTCEHGQHAPSDHPCGLKAEMPGSPCRYCSKPVPPDGSPCPECWTSLEGLVLPDLKAIFASSDLSLSVAVSDDHT